MLTLFLLLLVIAAFAGAALLVHRRRQLRRRPFDDDDPDWPLPPLVFPARATADRDPWPDAARHEPATFETAPLADPRPAAEPVGDAPPNAREGSETGEPVDAGPIRFHRPPDGTLQLLPGRLEIVSGGEEQEEIRFVRVSGRDTVVTFGRSAGEPHLHVQLQSPTVSRLHASLSFHQGRWYISNHSLTNPVVLNGRQMPATAGGWIGLDDGDLIEFGEVAFRFRSR